MPSTAPKRLGATNWRISAGAGVQTSRKPTPSSALSANNCAAVCIHPARAPAPTSTPNPASMQRLRPNPSASKPAARPSVMPASCTAESKNPAWTKLMPNDSRSTGNAGKSLARCSAALTPARMITVAAHGAAHGAGCVAGLVPKRPGSGEALTTAAWHPSGARVRALQSGLSCRQCSQRWLARPRALRPPRPLLPARPWHAHETLPAFPEARPGRC